MLQRMRQIGRRTAEMHRAFASSDDIAAFAPEPITAEDVARWTDAGLARTALVFKLLGRDGAETERACGSERATAAAKPRGDREISRGSTGTRPSRPARSAITAISISARC